MSAAQAPDPPPNKGLARCAPRPPPPAPPGRPPAPSSSPLGADGTDPGDPTLAELERARKKLEMVKLEYEKVARSLCRLATRHLATARCCRLLLTARCCSLLLTAAHRLLLLTARCGLLAAAHCSLLTPHWRLLA